MELIELSIINSDKRRVKGWANVDVKDLGGDAIPIDVMNNAMLDFISIVGGNVFFKHKNKPVGKILQWAPKMNPKAGRPGIEIVVEFFEGYLLYDIVWNAVKNKILKGFSIGADVPNPKTNIIHQDGKNIPKVININEISAVFDPMNTYATIDEISQMAKSRGGGEEDTAELLRFLEEWKKALEGGCGTDNCSTKCGRCKSMEEKNKALEGPYETFREKDKTIQEVPPDVQRLMDIHGNENGKVLVEILSEADWKKLLPGKEDQLAKGIQVEMEHTEDPEVAKKIAEDHIAEDPQYYDKLESLELTKGCGDMYNDEEKETASKEKANEGIFDGQAPEGQEQAPVDLEDDVTKITTSDKARKYITDAGSAPEGVSVQTGPKGGQYYESTERTPEEKEYREGHPELSDENLRDKWGPKPGEKKEPGTIPKQPSDGKEKTFEDLSPKAQGGMKNFAGSSVDEMMELNQKYEAETGKNPRNVHNKEDFFSWVAEQKPEKKPATPGGKTPGKISEIDTKGMSAVEKLETMSEEFNERNEGMVMEVHYKTNPQTGSKLADGMQIKDSSGSVESSMNFSGNTNSDINEWIDSHDDSERAQAARGQSKPKTPKAKKGRKGRAPGIGGYAKPGTGTSGKQSDKSWWERQNAKAQNKSKSAELRKENSIAAIPRLARVDYLFTMDKPDKEEIKNTLTLLKPFMDMDQEADEMLDDIFYYISEDAFGDASRLWDRFKIIYAPALPVEMGVMSKSEAEDFREERHITMLKGLTKELKDITQVRKLQAMTRDVQDLRKEAEMQDTEPPQPKDKEANTPKIEGMIKEVQKMRESQASNTQ